MQVAIVGAGLAGLATAYFLLQSQQVQVILFDSVGVGGGASSVCSGLLHPYPGLNARRSYQAQEALQVAKQLICAAEAQTAQIVAVQNGIFRQPLDATQKELLLAHSVKWGDVKQVEEDLFLIHTGITVCSKNYLEGLWSACQKLGAKLIIQKIESLDELTAYDQIVLAAGSGTAHFPQCRDLKIKYLKGQALYMEGNPPFERSFISKGYIAYGGEPTHFEVGSTYEREFTDDLPNQKIAEKLLQDKLTLFCSGAKILECRAGVRVMPREGYLPTIQKVGENVHVFTGLGSRGLLYHGLFGKLLAQEICKSLLQEQVFGLN